MRREREIGWEGRETGKIESRTKQRFLLLVSSRPFSLWGHKERQRETSMHFQSSSSMVLLSKRGPSQADWLWMVAERGRGREQKGEGRNDQKVHLQFLLFFVPLRTSQLVVSSRSILVLALFSFLQKVHLFEFFCHTICSFLPSFHSVLQFKFFVDLFVHIFPLSHPESGYHLETWVSKLFQSFFKTLRYSSSVQSGMLDLKVLQNEFS